ncbi:MAG: cytochrome C oxidase subunit IV family protein [Bradymonadaceae bacterium]|nr:cytochrome C oxidase subunit IV family protein [Lujinxingiaceae bacterium]
MATHKAADAAHHDPNAGWGWLGVKGLYNQYMWVWLALLIFTAIEVVIPEPAMIGLDFHFPRLFVVSSLIVIALVKTWLVAWYYMHLIAERPSIILVACCPFVFSLFLTIGLFPWRF